MNTLAIVLTFLFATITNSRGLRRPVERLPEQLERYMNESILEKPPTDEEVIELTKKFVDQKLIDDEKSVTWALKASNITALEGQKLTGDLYIYFRAIIRECPSETQKKMSSMLKFAVKDPNDNCKPNVIDMKAEHPCALRYSRYAGSHLSCSMLRGGK